jgi:uncharacterized membrane protein YgcG
MAKMARLLVVAILVLLPQVGTHAAGAQTSSDEAIRGFGVVITIERNGTLHIRESITYDFGHTAHHGLLRDLVERELYNGTHDRRYRIDLEGVSADRGASSAVRRSTRGSYLHLRIGDPNHTITGIHHYELLYTVRGAPLTFADHDELNWDPIGSQWPVPIQNAQVTVRAPAAIGRVACYAGPPGSALPCDGASSADTYAAFLQRSLAPGSGLTIVVALPKGTIQPPPAPILETRKTVAGSFAVTPLTAGLTTAVTAAGIGLVITLATRRGRDRRFTGSAVDAAMGNASGAEEPAPILGREPEPVEFVPPDGIRPGQVGTLLDEHANLLDVTASIVDLAVRGWLTIKELEPERHARHPDYELAATPVAGSGELLAYEETLLHELFDDHATVNLSDLKYQFRSSLTKIQTALYNDTVAQGWYRFRPDRTRTNWVAIATLELVVAGSATVIVASATSFGLVPLGFVATGLALLVAAGRMPARTGKGTAMLSRVRGFRRLFDEGEEDARAHFAEQHDIFSQYLPYAIVFGCTHKWAKAFEGIAADQLETSWFTGTQPFDALVLASAIDHFGTAATGTMYASMPSSSGASGFGGFSGGGGGGGGGGSW